VLIPVLTERRMCWSLFPGVSPKAFRLSDHERNVLPFEQRPLSRIPSLAIDHMGW